VADDDAPAAGPGPRTARIYCCAGPFSRTRFAGPATGLPGHCAVGGWRCRPTLRSEVVCGRAGQTRWGLVVTLRGEHVRPAELSISCAELACSPLRTRWYSGIDGAEYPCAIRTFTAQAGPGAAAPPGGTLSVAQPSDLIDRAPAPISPHPLDATVRGAVSNNMHILRGHGVGAAGATYQCVKLKLFWSPASPYFIRPTASKTPRRQHAVIARRLVSARLPDFQIAEEDVMGGESIGCGISNAAR